MDNKPQEIRVRIAPSPTGSLHIGTARTALFNYLFAKKNKGSFILRIEDTDKERCSQEWETNITESLNWLGINWDEGPIADAQNQKYTGNYGPYKQSERLDIYSKYIKKLLDEGKAYYCFCSKQEIESKKQYQMSIGEAPHYDGKCRDLSESQVKEYLSEKKPSVIRFKIPRKKVFFNDLIRGRVEFDSSLFGDIAIAKNLTSPLYNLAVVIDDFEMKITHIIRGEDHISNTPKQILLQEALGFFQPEYAHIPLILGQDKTKLSKRHGATAITDFKQDGYLSGALINFMALLGWNPGDEREIFSTFSLIKEFSLEKIQKGGAIFNIKKLDWLNGFYIRKKNIERLTELCLPYLIEKGLIAPYEEKEIFQEYIITETKEKISFDKLKEIISIHQERLKKLSEISELTDYFFKAQLEYDKELLKWKNMDAQEIENSLNKSEEILSKIESNNFKKENLEKILMAEAERMGPEAQQVGYRVNPEAQQAGFRVKDRGKLLWPLRAALSGKKASAGPMEIAEILGKEETLKRIREAKNKLHT